MSLFSFSYPQLMAKVEERTEAEKQWQMEKQKVCMRNACIMKFHLKMSKQTSLAEEKATYPLSYYFIKTFVLISVNAPVKIPFSRNRISLLPHLQFVCILSSSWEMGI